MDDLNPQNLQALRDQQLAKLNLGETMSGALADVNGNLIVDSDQNAYGDLMLGSRPADLSEWGRHDNRRNVGQLIVHNITATLTDIRSGAVKRARISRKERCQECLGRRTLEDLDVECEECHGVGRVNRPNPGYGFAAQARREIPCNRCAGQGFIVPAGKECWNCAGESRVTTPVVVDINLADLDQGRIILAGQGNDPENQDGERGDIEIRVECLPDRHFAQAGDRIFFEKRISFSDAILGPASTWVVDFVTGTPVAFTVRDHVIEDQQIFYSREENVYVKFVYDYPPARLTEEQVASWTSGETQDGDGVLLAPATDAELSYLDRHLKHHDLEPIL